MTNKKKKSVRQSIQVRRLIDLEQSHHALEKRVEDLERFSHQANAKIMDLENLLDGHMTSLREINEAAQNEAELRVQAESMVYRKLIHTLMADRKSVDMFLDKLSDLAPEIAKGVLVGTFEALDGIEGVRPKRSDDTPKPL